MGRRGMWVTMLVASILGAAIYVGKVLATPASGFTSASIAIGRFGEFDVSNHRVTSALSRPWERDLWLSMQKTKGLSDLYVQSNVWAPGGTTGWHSHPGHSLITVTAGTLTAYHGDDSSCTPVVYTPGMGFVDPGDDHVHIVRNEGAVEARSITVQLIPAGATRRIDAEGNPACPF